MPDPTERDELIEGIAAVQDDMTRLFANDRSHPLLASNLTMQQLKVVVLLTHETSLSGQDLSRRLGVGLGTVTGIVDRLVSQELVHRFEDQQDRRVRRVELAPAGQRLAAEFTDAGAARFRQLLDLLDMDTLRDFDKVMRKIRIAIRESDEYQAIEHQTIESSTDEQGR